MPNREAWLPDPAPQREAILTALERLLAWPEIARSPQLGRFLDYIVQRTLEGNEQAIKAYSIAVDVFGRAADFDPQVDPIVRVQARRLRGLLDEYYRGAGSDEAVQISLPVGRYIPEFSAAPAVGRIEAPPHAARSAPRRRRGLRRQLPPTWFVLALIALLAAVAAYALSNWGPASDPNALVGVRQRPTITIVEFQNLANGARVAPQVAGLAIELVTDLEQFGDLKVRYGGGGSDNIAVSGLPTSDYVLTGIVRPEGAVVQYSAILTDSVTSSVVWDHTLAVPAADAAASGVLDTVSKSLSLVLGSPRGPLHVRARQALASGELREGQVNLYLCRVLFDLYRETGGAPEAERASACFAALSETDQQDAMALAATASLLAENPVPEMTRAERFALATTWLEQAIGINPISAFIWEQLGRLHEGQALLLRARADFSSSVQLNPANADALAAYARLLALGGSLTEAEPMARDAAEATPAPPPWYQGVPALLALRDGDFAAAIAAAELYAVADRELGPILAIMAGQGAGDSAVVNRYLPQVLDVASFRAKGVLPRLRERIGDVALIDSMHRALLRAGVPSAALTGAF